MKFILPLNFNAQKRLVNENWLKDVANVLSGKLLLTLISFLTGVLIARILGPEGRGEYAIFTLSFSILTIVVNFGLPESLVRQYCIEESTSTDKKLFISGLYISIFIYIIVSCALFVYNIYANEASTFKLLGFIVIIIFFESILTHFRHYCIGKKDFKKYNISQIISGLSLFLLVFALVFIKKVSYVSIISCYILADFTSFIYIFFKQKKLSWSKLDFKPNTNLIKILLNGSYKFLLTSIFGLLTFRIAYYYIKDIMDLRSVGIFSVAGIFPGFVNQFSMQLSIVLYPHVASDSSASGWKLTKFAIKIMFIFSIIVILFFVFFGGLIIRIIYGVDYYAAYSPMILLFITYFFISISSLLINYSIGKGRYNIMLFSSLISVLVIIITIKPLILIRGLNGVGYSMIASSALSLGFTLLMLYLSQKKSRSS